MRKNMDLTIPNKNDKDAQIEFLKNALIEVKNEINTLYESSKCTICCGYHYSEFKTADNAIKNIVDFIDKRICDVQY